jgi:iron(III) transport system ATP-binding protein
VNSAFLRLTSVFRQFERQGGVCGVSLEVGAGERVAVAGPSASGKTTLLRLIAGLEIPQRGEIWLGGRQVSAAGANMVAPHERRVGFVFQDLALWPHMTVREHLTFVLDAARVPATECAERIQETLALCHLDSRLGSRYPHQLSGGEQQRLALGRALAGRPQLLLLDEPFSSLDPELRREVRDEVTMLVRQLRLTTMCVSHDREDATAFADRLVEMRHGAIAAG